MDGTESPLLFESFKKSRENPFPGNFFREDIQLTIAKYNVLNWIDIHRIPEVGPLDIKSTAESLGIPLDIQETYYCHGEVKGLVNNDRIEVIVRNNDEIAHTFGHEVGHIFAKLVIGIANSNRDETEEEFCERFGTVFALPERELALIEFADEKTLAWFAREYKIGIAEVAYRLIDRGLLPSRFYIRHNIDCNNEKEYLEVLCQPCHQEYGSCLGMEAPDLMLDFTGMDIDINVPCCRYIDSKYVQSKNFGQLVLEGMYPNVGEL